MQINRVPVLRDMIFLKVIEKFHSMYGTTISTGLLARGWIDRFMNHHPFITLRSSQIIKRLQVEATLGGLRYFQQIIKACGQ